MTTTVHIPTLETERLILRAPRVTDFASFAAFLGDERAKYIGGPYDDAKLHQRAFLNIAGVWMLRGYSMFIWALKNGTPIGHGGPWQPLDHPSPELGWSLWSASHEGHGYATEAMKAALDWARGLKLRGLWAGIEPGNDASMRLAERLGGTRNPVDLTPDGEAIPCWTWADAEVAQ